jgi:putative endonuclease
MCHAYILQSETTGRYYVGSTNDLERRVSEHLRSHSLATRRRGPWKLVHAEEFPTLIDARRRELEIKRWKSAKLIQALKEVRRRRRATSTPLDRNRRPP